MTAPNHIVGGFTVTGIFASIGGINILQDYRLLPIILIAALLPDIDHPKSIIGTLFRPISKVINRKYGHRTITHSLMVWIGLTALVSAFQSAYFPEMAIAQVFGMAYGSHLLLDLVTVQGIPLFYPFKKNACVLPGNPHMRLRTSNLRHETMAFCVFIIAAVFMKPLMADGFWTSYNRLFGTLQHLVSEHHKSEDLLQVNFTIQHGSEFTTHEGLCVAVDNSSLTILTTQNQFETYPKEGQQIKDIFPEHTQRGYQFIPGRFHEISIDSFYQLFNQGLYTEIKIQGNKPFLYYQDGLEKKGSVMSLDYPNEIRIKEIQNNKTVDFMANPAISRKKEQISILTKTYNQSITEYDQKLAAYELLRVRMEEETDHIQKELLMLAFQKAKAPTLPKGVNDKIIVLESEIKQLKKEDQLVYQKKLEEVREEVLVLSGQYMELIISNNL